MWIVYCLQDPRDSRVYYVGQTSDVYARFIEHLRCAENNGEKNKWVHELKSLGIVPIMCSLETAHTEREAKAGEEYWIRHYQRIGMPITNVIKRTHMKRKRVQPIPEVPPAILEDEKIAEFKRLRVLGFNQKTIILRLWGAYPGESRAYKDARAEYIQILQSIKQEVQA